MPESHLHILSFFLFILKTIEPPLCTIEENPQDRRAPPPVRVDRMIEQVRSRLPDTRPTFILCVLADRKNSEIYGQTQHHCTYHVGTPSLFSMSAVEWSHLISTGPWKKKALIDLGIFNQCLAPQRVNEQYLTNLLLKINAKVIHILLAVAFRFHMAFCIHISNNFWLPSARRIELSACSRT